MSIKMIAAEYIRDNYLNFNLKTDIKELEDLIIKAAKENRIGLTITDEKFLKYRYSSEFEKILNDAGYIIGWGHKNESFKILWN